MAVIQKMCVLYMPQKGKVLNLKKCLYLGPGPFRVTNTLVLFGDEKLLKELHKHIQSKKLQVSVAHYVKEYESN